MASPPRCGACGAPCHWRDVLCRSCERALGRARSIPSRIPGLDAVWSATPYDGVARRLVSGLKFARRLPLARRAATSIVDAAPAGLLDGELVPVPADPLRVRLRGLDPAEEIAIALAELSGLSLRPCLARAPGRRQVGRRRFERIAHPLRVAALDPVPASALLVDDVLTTGATLGACARALRSAGAARVGAVTFARSTAHQRAAPRSA